jgi:tetratricopeptide (TPR) repeat protein
MRRAWPNFLAAAILALVGTSAYAQRDRDTYNPSNQTFEVSGQANLAGTNSPVREIPVRLERFSGGIVDQINTDSRGRFRFPNLQRGFYKVIINAPGFSPAQQEADLTVLFKVYLIFTLAHEESNSSTIGNAGVIDARVPPSAREEFNRGRTALARKSFPEANSHFQKAISIYPEFFEAELLLGTAYMDQRDWKNSEAALLRALAIKSGDPPTMLALGEVYWRQKRYEEAERILREGLKLDERNWHGHFTLARLYWDQGDAMKAGPCVGRTLQLRPDFAEAHLLAGNILLKLNQTQRAQVEYEEYLRLSPKGEFASATRDLLQKLSSKN